MPTDPHPADVELVARAEFEQDQAPEYRVPWDKALSFVKREYLARARVGLSALAAAGRLVYADPHAPTTTKETR